MHFDAGTIKHFDRLMSLAPELSNLRLYEAFLKAFAAHARSTLAMDSTSHPQYHWWTGSKVQRCYAFDRELHFNGPGRRMLAHRLAEKTLRTAAVDLALSSPMYLGKRLKQETKWTTTSNKQQKTSAAEQDGAQDEGGELNPEDKKKTAAGASPRGEARRLDRTSDE